MAASASTTMTANPLSQALLPAPAEVCACMVLLPVRYDASIIECFRLEQAARQAAAFGEAEQEQALSRPAWRRLLRVGQLPENKALFLRDALIPGARRRHAGKLARFVFTDVFEHLDHFLHAGDAARHLG